MKVNDGVDAAVIAHDLRNLLQIAASALRHIDRNLDNATRARVRPYEHAAAESLARAGALSHSLISRAAGSMSATDIVAPGLTLSAMMHLIVFAAGPAIEVDVEISDEVPNVTCCVHELENALLNLVANAKTAMPDGGRIGISARRERGMAVVSVCDTGMGMCADLAGRAFLPFFTTRGLCGGTGLGLAMVKDFAERAGGSAEIRSAIGIGTTVTMRLAGLPQAILLPFTTSEIDHEQ